MRTSYAVLLYALSAFAFSSPAVTVAQEVGDEATDMARERFNEGVAYFDKRQYEKARLAFLQAYALRAHPAVLLNLAQSELRSKHAPEAASHFAQYLRDHDAENVDAKKGLAQAKTKVVEVKVTSDADEVMVFVGDNELGRTPLKGSLFLLPGQHVIQGRFEGQVVNVTIDGQAGSTRQANLAIGGAMPAAAATSTASADAASPPPATPAMSAQNVPAPAAGEPRMDKEGFIDWYADAPVAWGLTVLAVGGVAAGVISALASNAQAASRGHTALDMNGYLIYRSGSDGTGEVLTRGTDGSYRNAAEQVVPEGMRAADASGSQGAIYMNYEADRLPTSSYYVSSGATSPDQVVVFPTQGDCTVMHVNTMRQAEFDTACTQWKDANEKAGTYQTLSIVGFAVAGASLIAIPVYYFLDRDDVETGAGGSVSRRASLVPQFGPAYQGFSVVGTF